MNRDIPFTKMTGAGNDFIVIDNRLRVFNLAWPLFARRICDRRYGIGGDGLLVIDPTLSAAFTMLYYNADGSSGGMCGNGGRCVSRFIMESSEVDSVTFEALGHVYRANLIGTQISLQMKNPIHQRFNILVDIPQYQVRTHFIDTGAPHAVLFTDEMPEPAQKILSTDGVDHIGREIRHHQVFAPDGTNVDFINISGDQTISMRTYERGVEGETLACGTGAVASALVGALQRGMRSPITIHTRGGEDLLIMFAMDGENFHDVSLQGSAKFVFAGRIRYSEANGIIDVIFQPE